MGETPEELEGGKALKLKPHPPTPRFSCSTWEHAVFNLLLYVLYQVFMPPVFMNHLLDTIGGGRVLMGQNLYQKQAQNHVVSKILYFHNTKI